MNNEEVNEWYQDPRDELQPEVSVAEIERLCAKIKDQREVVQKARDAYKLLENELDAIERSLVTTLTELGKTTYRSDVGTFTVRSKSMVRIPKDENRYKFFEYLKERGIFEDMVTVHSATLNAWYQQELTNAEERGEGMDFNIPGIPEPEITPTLAFRKNV